MADDTTRLDTNLTADDHIQHGIDDNPQGDAGKGAVLGGIGGVAVGAAAGAMAGPVGMVIGAVVGGLAGAAGSGAAVAAVDSMDNDNTISGIGDGVSVDADDETADLGVDTLDRLDLTQDDDRTVDVLPATRGYAGATGTGGFSDGEVTAGDLLDHTTPLSATDRAALDADTRLDNSRNDDLADDNIQHGIDDNPNHDAAKGAALGGIGGAAVGAAAGAAGGVGTGIASGAVLGAPGGPAGMAIGAAVGAVAGAVGAGVATAAVDNVDNDNNVTGVGSGVTRDPDVTNRAGDDLLPGNNVPGVQTGGHTADGSPDTRGIMEKASDAVTGDRIDDKTGKRVD